MTLMAQQLAPVFSVRPCETLERSFLIDTHQLPLVISDAGQIVWYFSVLCKTEYF